MALTPATNRQIPDHSIMDKFYKQAYLGNRFAYAFNAYELTSTSETAAFLLTNPLVASKAFPATYQSLFVDWKKLICVTASEDAILRFYLGPTFSAAGTAKTPINLRPASSTTSIALLSSGPTVSVNGSMIESSAANALASDASDKLCILDPGQSLLITAQASSTSTYIDFALEWNEI